MSELTWNNLLDFTCPKCEEPLKKGILEYYCTDPHCDFHIGKQRFTEVVQSMYDNDAKPWHDWDYDY